MPRPGKGPRDLISARVPPEHKERYQREAQQRGLELSDYLALRLAELHQLDRPCWIRGTSTKRQTQGVLRKIG